MHIFLLDVHLLLNKLLIKNYTKHYFAILEFFRFLEVTGKVYNI